MSFVLSSPLFKKIKVSVVSVFLRLIFTFRAAHKLISSCFFDTMGLDFI